MALLDERELQVELREALQSRHAIDISWLNRGQQTRSRGLLNFLKQALNGHSKSDHVIPHYLSTVSEGFWVSQ